MNEIKELCSKKYEENYTFFRNELIADARKKNKGRSLPLKTLEAIENIAQKEAIKEATLCGMRTFQEVDASVIWRSVYEIHVHRKSGIDDSDVINKVISANQSWIKSSGHAFEEMIKYLGNCALNSSNIQIVLQRDLSTLIKANELDNEPRDLSWLREQLAADIFDLYAIVTHDNKKYCYGCIQSKTSIRDRVTRDREPSINAMRSFFWSTIIVLDGEFLKNGKFVSMVNGGTSEHPTNGWHGLYVFSDKYTNDRIYETNFDFKNFKEHAIQAADYWLRNRQWFNTDWRV